MNEKFSKNAKVEKFTTMLWIAFRLIVIDPSMIYLWFSDTKLYKCTGISEVSDGTDAEGRVGHSERLVVHKKFSWSYVWGEQVTAIILRNGLDGLYPAVNQAKKNNCEFTVRWPTLSFWPRPWSL